MGQVANRLLALRKIEGEHWLFTGYVHPDGAGRIKVDQRFRLPHRLAWELWRGPIPKGHHVHHLCDRRDCFNPDHLQALSASEHHRLHKAVGEKCKRGHPLDDPSNVYVRPNGTRQCRTCRRMRDQKEKKWDR